MTSRTRALTLTILIVVVALAAGAALTFMTVNGSLAGNAKASPPATTRPVPTSTPSASPVALTRYDPTEPMTANFALFNSTATTTIAATPNPGGRTFTAALAAAGFDTSQMQLTADRTSANLDAPSILFSVKATGHCFIGQFTPSTREYNNQVVDPISTGSCLIGGTVPVH